jgi:uncharacterized membrane protein
MVRQEQVQRSGGKASGRGNDVSACCKKERTMKDIRSNVTIHCRKIRIWEYVSDPDNAPEWHEHITSVEWKTPKPAKLGSQINFTVRFVKRTFTYTCGITEWVPLEHVTLETVEGPFPVKIICSLRSLNENTTRITLRSAITLKGVSRLFSRLIAWMVKKANRRDLKKLKALLEERYGCDPLDTDPDKQ